MREGRSHDKQRKAIAKEKRRSLKSKGVIDIKSRDMVRKLVGGGVPMAHVDETIKTVCEGFGVEMEESIDRRSVSRITREGGVAAKIQIMYELDKSKACTINGDGTTNKHINYESKHIMMQVPSYAPGSNPDAVLPEDTIPTQRFLGINTAVNHTSEVQLQGWKKSIESILTNYNTAPIGQRNTLDVQDFARSVTGMMTDHAEDQKKLCRLFEDWKTLCEQEKQGEEALRSSELEDLHPILWEEIDRNLQEAGGQAAWDAPEEKEQREFAAYRRACARIGQDRIDAMTPAERKYIALFLWGGCSMHKEMNSVKGGSAAMAAYWKEKGLVGPLKLVNKDNRSAAASGSQATQDTIIEEAQGGAIKLCSLAGAVFAHKDKKKGQQDTLQIYMESIFGYMARFPDTSNTRYQSYCEAAAELLVKLEFYQRFLELVHTLKAKQSFTNIEKNVHDALSDIPTLTELCVLVLYSQGISHPFMRKVRGIGQESTNFLDLGDFYAELIAFIERLEGSICLILSPEASYETGSLDGRPWERPEAFYAVQRLATQLPHLEGVMLAFLRGAKETWVRFTSEFSSDGKIASASASERHCAWMKPTNDDNEGALGSYRVDKRNSPNLTLAIHNAKKMYRKNNTSSFMKLCFSAADYKSIMAQSRTIDAARLPALERDDQAEEYRLAEGKKHQAAVKQQARADKTKTALDKLSHVQDLAQLVLKPPNADVLKSQLDWYRREGDALIPKKSTLRYKAQVLEALVAAIERYNARLAPTKSSEGVEDLQEAPAADSTKVIVDVNDLTDSEDDEY
ncbi:hypothetical protein BOTBODRAFT_121805 [Botryobasidium botryosum FD-172 SS1]|uniref:Uncharacterized protein n=1 Tax=Botryobasidium botryosum (strain FD-172 SS1) TaxID=930990 RepID=A0A067LT27_BOTB1|nr:hypothetical protein BOTBODRAFT_121805 [Botryobasidium botryosum FD-172 SS1]